MIEIKNTKVRLYTVEEYKNYYNVSVLIPEMERILELSKGKEVILISQLTAIEAFPRYAIAIPMEYNYECVTITSEMIKEVITDGSTEPPMKYKVGDTVLIKPRSTLKAEGLYPKSRSFVFSEFLTIAGQEVVIDSKDRISYSTVHPLKKGMLITFEEEFIERLVEYPTSYEAHFNQPKPPLGIVPKRFYEEMANTARINDLWNAMDRYIKEGCKISPEWVEELKERYKMVEEY